MGINTPSDLEAELSIGPTDQGAGSDIYCHL